MDAASTAAPTVSDRARAVITEDEARIRAFLKGDERAFNQLVLTYRGRILAYCQLRLRRREDAEECALDTFCKAYFGLRTFQFRASFATWLYRIAQRTCVDRQRSAGYRQWQNMQEYAEDADGAIPQGALPLHGGMPDPRAACLQAERQQRVMEAISRLPATQQLAMTLWLLEGRGCADIATRMRISEDNVKMLLHRARQRISRQREIREVFGRSRPALVEHRVAAQAGV